MERKEEGGSEEMEEEGALSDTATAGGLPLSGQYAAVLIEPLRAASSAGEEAARRHWKLLSGRYQGWRGELHGEEEEEGKEENPCLPAYTRKPKKHH